MALTSIWYYTNLPEDIVNNNCLTLSPTSYITTLSTL
jgi:hypothetical protein